MNTRTWVQTYIHTYVCVSLFSSDTHIHTHVRTLVSLIEMIDLYIRRYVCLRSESQINTSIVPFYPHHILCNEIFFL